MIENNIVLTACGKRMVIGVLNPHNTNKKYRLSHTVLVVTTRTNYAFIDGESNLGILLVV